MEYKVLNQQTFSTGKFQIVPIRYEDRHEIMRWRNEQIYHLRQKNLLTPKEQDEYFQNVISKLFYEDSPDQILFSYLVEGKCEGYGGLVHINWVDHNAEVSFLMNTQIESDFFELNWSNFIDLISRVAFTELNLHKIFTYAFDLRPRLYDVLERSGFKKEAILREHCLFQNNYIDVIIHSKIQ